MPVTFPRTFPTVNGSSIIEKMTIRQVNAVAVQQSPYTYQQQIQDFGGQRWEAEVTIRPLAHAEALAFQGFLASLQGQKNTFLLGNPIATSNNASNDIRLSSSHDAGDSTLAVLVNTFHEASAGQFFSISDRLYMFLEDVDANGTYDITPPLRSDASAYSNCVTNLPKGTWRLASNKIDWDISKAGLYSFTFACVEAL
tara:strand:- start:90 stop:683 length:594 start_codon:yes stop_codon:yes gene_type:complete